MTVEEFLRLPEDRGETYHELHHGEIITLTRPTMKHWLIQRNLTELLKPLIEPGSCVGMELAFRPAPEHASLAPENWFQALLIVLMQSRILSRISWPVSCYCVVGNLAATCEFGLIRRTICGRIEWPIARDLILMVLEAKEGKP